MNHCLIFNISSDDIIRGFGSYKIAHHLRKNNWDAEVIDYTISWKFEELKELVKSRVNSNTKFIGFGQVFTYWTERLEAFTKWLKENYSDLYLIAGMQQFPTYKANYIDYYIIGHAENALLALLSQLFSNGKFVTQTKFSWSNKKIILANTLDSKYHAGYTTDLEVQYQNRDFIREGEWLSMEFSRGCKFKCAFCDFPYLNAKGNYILAKETFVKNMKENYDRFGVKNYLVADSTFNETTEKIKTYADGVQELNFDPFFSGFLRGDLIISRPQDKEHLLKMGFLGHAYGIETLNHKSGKSIGKGMHPHQIKQGIHDIYHYFNTHGRKLFAGTFSFIVGLPHETKESISSTIEWINTLPSEIYISIHPLTIDSLVYGNSSKFALDWKKYGYIDQDIVQDQYRDQSRKAINWKNEHMTLDEATKIAKSVSDKVNGTDVWILATNAMHGMKIEDRLKTPATYYDGPAGRVNTEKFIKNYIQNKLNWRSS